MIDNSPAATKPEAPLRRHGPWPSNLLSRIRLPAISAAALILASEQTTTDQVTPSTILSSYARAVPSRELTHSPLLAQTDNHWDELIRLTKRDIELNRQISWGILATLGLVASAFIVSIGRFHKSGKLEHKFSREAERLDFLNKVTDDSRLTARIVVGRSIWSPIDRFSGPSSPNAFMDFRDLALKGLNMLRGEIEITPTFVLHPRIAPNEKHFKITVSDYRDSAVKINLWVSSQGKLIAATTTSCNHGNVTVPFNLFNDTTFIDFPLLDRYLSAVLAKIHIDERMSKRATWNATNKVTILNLSADNLTDFRALGNGDNSVHWRN